MYSLGKESIRVIVQEELQGYLEELALCHDPRTGHFDTCQKAGNVYSLSAKGAEAGNVASRFVQRGTLTKSKSRGDVPRLKAKYGLNTSRHKQGGRLEMRSGESIPPTYSVSRYPQRYSQTRKQVLDEVSLAMTEWLTGQTQSIEELDEGGDVACRAERQAAFKAGQQTALNFIRNYEASKKGE
jgi:hypothetical protein